ncbi:hypothetical protein V2J09_013474 [Rumex salicifolius]
MPSHKSFMIKKKLGKKMRQNRPIPYWIRMRTDNTISAGTGAVPSLDSKTDAPTVVPSSVTVVASYGSLSGFALSRGGGFAVSGLGNG